MEKRNGIERYPSSGCRTIRICGRRYEPGHKVRRRADLPSDAPLVVVLHGYTGKADPAMHGIGLSSIQKAVKRYGGSAETQFENDGGWFRLMIMIPVPEK